MASNISVSSGKDGCLQLWRYQPGTLRMVACEVPSWGGKMPHMEPPLQADSTHQGWVRGLEFDPSSGLLVSAGDDGVPCWQSLC